MSNARLGLTKPLVTPLYQSSVYQLPDLDCLDRVIAGHEPGFIYARDAHPNARSLADKLAELEGAAWALVSGSGMAALSAACLALVSAGDRIIAADRLYGRTSALLRNEFKRFGVACDFVDTNNLAAVELALQVPARILLVETISNPLLRIADLPALARLAHNASCLLLVDNTFASPELIRPLDHGADIAMESLTKIIGGHSDVTLGLLASNDRSLLPKITQTMSIWGLSAAPFDCWLAERGIETLAVRMQTACANARELADWLPAQPGIAQVIYPSQANHPDHELAKRLFQGRFGHMLCLELAGADGRAAVNHFMRHAPGIPFSPSLGDTATTCSHPATTSHRYETPEEKRRQGITDGLIRLSVGIEAISDIKARILQGLEGL